MLCLLTLLFYKQIDYNFVSAPIVSLLTAYNESKSILVSLRKNYFSFKVLSCLSAKVALVGQSSDDELYYVILGNASVQIWQGRRKLAENVTESVVTLKCCLLPLCLESRRFIQL